MISIGCYFPRALSSSIAGLMLTFLCCLGVFLSSSVQAEPLKVEAPKVDSLKIIVPPWSNDPNSQNAYFIKLLTLAFSKTEVTDGPVVIQKHTENLTGVRFVADLKNNKTVDVIWHGTNLQREQDLIAIPISLTRELNEYRVLLIRKEDQEKFDQVKSLADLRKFTAGTAIDWPSRDILLHNNLPVMAVANTNLLYTMLKMKRFDYMSRNMFEVWEEAERYENEGLVVEKNLLLHGGVPFYFFVSKAKPQLAERIERGLRMAIADGDFEKLFLSEARFKRGTAELVNSKRLLLELDTNVAAPH